MLCLNYWSPSSRMLSPPHPHYDDCPLPLSSSLLTHHSAYFLFLISLIAYDISSTAHFFLAAYLFQLLPRLFYLPLPRPPSLTVHHYSTLTFIHIILLSCFLTTIAAFAHLGATVILERKPPTSLISPSKYCGSLMEMH